MPGRFGEDAGAGRRGEVKSVELFAWLMVVCGLKVTVLCGFEELELEAVGGDRSGDDSVEVEAIPSMRFLFLTQFTRISSLTLHPLETLYTC